MMDFIKCPNLPEKTVKTLICGSTDERIISFFESRGISVIISEKNPDIAKPVSVHADMSCLHLGDNIIIVDKRQKELKNSLEKMGMKVYETDEIIRGEYPDDIRLNVALLGDFAIGSFRNTDKTLLQLLNDRKLIDVNQGYSKCSALIVNSRAVITDDESVFKAVSVRDIDCLLISKGDIMLEGYNYGFIGGASGKISADTVVFFGSIEKHRDFDAIKQFLKKHNCRYVCTDDGMLRDIGGIVTLTEE